MSVEAIEQAERVLSLPEQETFQAKKLSSLKSARYREPPSLGIQLAALGGAAAPLKPNCQQATEAASGEMPCGASMQGQVGKGAGDLAGEKARLVLAERRRLGEQR